MIARIACYHLPEADGECGAGKSRVYLRREAPDESPMLTRVIMRVNPCK